jgi:hypothetical protein
MEYNESNGKVTSEYAVTTQPRQGNETKTTLATVPYQGTGWVSVVPIAGTYVSPRGETYVLPQVSPFPKRMVFNGELPEFPTVGHTPDLKSELKDLVRTKVSRGAFEGSRDDTHWTEKALGRTTQLARIGDQLELFGRRDALLRQIKDRLTDYPTSYGSDTDLNDHRFRYGYFVAAAELSQHDPA